MGNLLPIFNLFLSNDAKISAFRITYPTHTVTFFDAYAFQ